jgi:hypothetical protein
MVLGLGVAVRPVVGETPVDTKTVPVNPLRLVTKRVENVVESPAYSVGTVPVMLSLKSFVAVAVTVMVVVVWLNVGLLPFKVPVTVTV